MKKIKLLSRLSVLIVIFLLATATNRAQTISDHFFGVNAWMPDTIGNASNCTDPPCILNGKLHKKWGDIKNSKAEIVRFGGIAADKNKPTNYQYIRMIDSIRANGMEPIIQVPFRNYRYTASQAAAIVQYINITKGKNIKYWIIGNEPDLGYNFTTASQIAAYIKPFASAMKAIDPTIKIIGPECAWFNQGIIDGLTTPGGASDITGKDANGRYYIDYISFHTYPFNGTQTRASVISKLMSSGSLNDDLAHLNTRLNNCNTAHGRTGTNALKSAITEANIDYQNASTDNLWGVGANSFIGGQFIAEMMAISLKNKVDIFNLWSVVEGNSVTNNIGYINPSNGNKKPSYYHFKMMAENFTGTFVWGTTNQTNAKAFGSKNGSEIKVMIMNQDATIDFNYTLRLSSSAITGTNQLKINVNAGVEIEYTDVIPNQSTVLLTFNSDGVLIKKCEYTLKDHASANLPPACADLIATSTDHSEFPREKDEFELKIFPNPSIGKFTIQLDKQNYEERIFNFELYNLLGQLVIEKKLPFLKGKEEIELDPAIANGGYIVRVKEGNVVRVEKIILSR